MLTRPPTGWLMIAAAHSYFQSAPLPVAAVTCEAVVPECEEYDLGDVALPPAEPYAPTLGSIDMGAAGCPHGLVLLGGDASAEGAGRAPASRRDAAAEFVYRVARSGGASGRSTLLRIAQRNGRVYPKPNPLIIIRILTSTSTIGGRRDGLPEASQRTNISANAAITKTIVSFPNATAPSLPFIVYLPLNGNSPVDIVLETTLLPDARVSKKFLAPHPPPPILHNVRIKDVKIKPVGQVMVVSGTVLAHVVLPSGIEVVRVFSSTTARCPTGPAPSTAPYFKLLNYPMDDGY
ncbi:uncharacterized protein B0H18DRAFT_952523 [Fomitopsis serialis]|uniref:uncharacterized protein n=1 Tax=Fomitopsis serialis TaxID=139415 RepID=UPI0020072E0A|nr:uncharacterized protein B0H18DRAFT_952523 [Neoantrodia serialis]KAH9931845.1 hypothetical protein B0H18DRAFT_952523 [Neoantrodia serialis]